MDSAYLKQNVLPALAEAITSMAVELPEDRAEYIGKYLLSYVERNRMIESEVEKLNKLNYELDEYEREQQKLDQVKLEEQKKKDSEVDKYSNFLSSLKRLSTKDEIVNKVCQYIEDELKIPSAYFAYKTQEGEKEVLKYMNAGKNSKNVLGKKLYKPVEEEEEEGAYVPKGLTFDVFKRPEQPEEEEVEPELDEEGNEIPRIPKGPPPLEPLVVPNVKREKRIKFFSIPMLGSYVATPIEYKSGFYDGGLVLQPADEEQQKPEKYEFVKKDTHAVLAVDNIGSFRLFSKDEIEKLKEMAKIIEESFAKIEEQQEETYLSAISSEDFTSIASAVNEFATRAPDGENNAVAALAPPPAPEGEEAPAPAPAPAEEENEGGDEEEKQAEPVEAEPEGWAELRKNYNEALARYNYWVEEIETNFKHHIITFSKIPLDYINKNSLLIFSFLCNLLHVSSDNCNDLCDDPSWNILQEKFLPQFFTHLKKYDSKSPLPVGIKSLNDIKTQLESYDVSSLPPSLNLLSGVLFPFLSKIIALREASINLALEIEGKKLE